MEVLSVDRFFEKFGFENWKGLEDYWKKNS